MKTQKWKAIVPKNADDLALWDFIDVYTAV